MRKRNTPLNRSKPAWEPFVEQIASDTAPQVRDSAELIELKRVQAECDQLGREIETLGRRPRAGKRCLSLRELLDLAHRLYRHQQTEHRVVEQALRRAVP